ncbi:unnamed protein product, partial [Polarella glacialis]
VVRNLACSLTVSLNVGCSYYWMVSPPAPCLCVRATCHARPVQFQTTSVQAGLLSGVRLPRFAS